MDLPQLSQHHVFSDKILTLLPPEALPRLQTTCTHLQSHIQDLPEAIWVQAACSQLPAYHPIFRSLHTVRAYLCLHSDMHKAFSPSQAPVKLAEVSMSWAKGSTASPDFSKSACIKDQEVMWTELTTGRLLGTWDFSTVLQGRKVQKVTCSPSGKHLCAVLWPEPPVDPDLLGFTSCHIIDTKAGAVDGDNTAPPGCVGCFCGWAPDGQQFWCVAQGTGPANGHQIASIYGTSCTCIAHARLPHGMHRAWAPDSTAVAMCGESPNEIWLWTLSGGLGGVCHSIMPCGPPHSPIQWSPDSSLVYCTMAHLEQLLCYDRQASLVHSCMLSIVPTYACLGCLRGQEQQQQYSAAIVQRTVSSQHAQSVRALLRAIVGRTYA